MAKDQDLDELAKRYLDLWQDQVSALAADPAFGETVQRMWSLFGLAPVAPVPTAGAMGSTDPFALARMMMAGLSGSGLDSSGKDGANDASDGKRSASSGAKAAASASDAGRLDLGELTERLAALEERLDRLERRAAGKRRRPGAKTAKRAGGKGKD